jgi:hypothetical protein
MTPHYFFGFEEFAAHFAAHFRGNGLSFSLVLFEHGRLVVQEVDSAVDSADL